MGTWTFSRVEDMFSFFRRDTLKINPSYWAEKLLNGTSGGRKTAQVFDEESFHAALEDQLTNYYEVKTEKLNGIKAELEQQLNWHEGDGQYAFYQVASDFEHEGFKFDPCELPSGMVYQYHFIWCLYAIVWAIQQYDSQPAIVAHQSKHDIFRSETS